jgi:hypothetical protein
MNQAASRLIEYCRENRRVCPQPGPWQALWEMLPERRQNGTGWEPPVPLILGAWHYASNLEKMLRLSAHIEWADKHGMLLDVAAFLHSLTETDWHHLGD